MEPKIIERQGFQALGFKWQGTFDEASQGNIKKLFPQLKEVSEGIDNKVEPGVVKGLSYHNLGNGFTFYLCYEVSEIEAIKYGLEIIEVPPYMYALIEHEGADIMQSYQEIYSWVEENGYTLDQQILEHLEEYPSDYDPYEDELRVKIYIPVKK